MRALALLAVVVIGCLTEDSALSLPRQAPCEIYAVHVHRAPFGTRIVVDATFDPYSGVVYPLPTGLLVMEPVIFTDAAGDHLGAIGRAPDAGPDMCRWYPPAER